MITLRRNSRREATAYHEAGHAVVCNKLGIHVQSITIEPNGESRGECSHAKIVRGKYVDSHSPRSRMQLEHHIMVCLAGVTSQRLWRASSVRSYQTSGDYQEAQNAATKLNQSEPETALFLKWLRLRTKLILESNWKTVEALAADLMRDGTITIKRPTINDPVTAEKIEFFWR